MSSTKLLNIMSWNATGIMSSSSYLCDVLQKLNIDFCGISEHWLMDKTNDFLNMLDNNYKNVTVIDNECKHPYKRRSGKGGVALLWHAKYDRLVSVIPIDDDRVVGIQFNLGGGDFLFIFQVYLPCINHTADAFSYYIDKLFDLWSMYSILGTVMFIGDFNAKYILSHHGQNRQRDKEFSQFLSDCNRIAIDTLPLCVGAKSTYVSYDKRSESLIDHICLPVEKQDCIVYCRILDDNCLNVSNHRPVVCSLKLPHNTNSSYNMFDSNGPYRINWSKVSEEELCSYVSTLNDSELLLKSRFCNVGCIKDINDLYDCIVKSISDASNKSIKERKFKHFLKPYWNSCLTELNKKLKLLRNEWVLNGKPRDSASSFVNYKNAKREFRRLHRHQVKNYLYNEDRKLDECAELDQNRFWQTFKCKTNKNNCAGNEMKFGDKTFRDTKSITEQWQFYFESLYTHSNNDAYDSKWEDTINKEVTNILSSLEHYHAEPVKINIETFCDCLKLCQRGKMCGFDNVYYEHIIHGGLTLHWALIRLFSAMLTFGHVPPKMNRGVIVTLHKGGGKRKDDPHNYRAITLTSSILKLFESILLLRFENIILKNLSPQQGGFQRNLGCIMTSFAVQEAINFTQEHNSKAFIAFLDSRQAFDRVWHNGLIFKLHELGIDHTSLKTIISLYSSMQSCVRYKGHVSDWFSVSQGTRQGGKSSPSLYLVYINVIIQLLEDS